MTTKRSRPTLKKTWSQIAKTEADAIGAATRAVEKVPAPAEMVDKALVFAAHTLKSQREALVPLLKGVGPTRGRSNLPAAASAVSSAYLLAERIVEKQRKLLRDMTHTVQPPAARHAVKGRVVRAKAVRRGRAVPRKRTPARRAA